MWKNAKIIGDNQTRGEAGQQRGDKDFVMSRSQLVSFADCPAKWKDGGEVRVETKAMTFGSVLDCLVTSPESFKERFAVTPETYPATPTKKSEPSEQKPWTTRANFCKDWEAAKVEDGFIVVSPEQYGQAQIAYKALHEHREIASLFECSKKQVLMTADWQDDDTGLNVPFSALVDLLPHVSSPTWGKCLADIKTARNGNPAQWDRVCDDSGYDVQAALYFDIYRAAVPNEDRTDFVHIVQENAFPFHVVSPPPAFSTEFMEWGRSKYKYALRLYCHCLKTETWPSYEQVGLTIKDSGGGNTQIISPDQLWNYKKCAGVGMKEFNMPPKTQPETENHDLTP